VGSVTALLPFVLLLLFWLLLMRSLRRRGPTQNQFEQTLEEIRDELRRIRRLLEERSP
jgi:cytochrome c-type biogenesis protein CcmH/NrfF